MLALLLIEMEQAFPGVRKGFVRNLSEAEWEELDKATSEKFREWVRMKREVMRLEAEMKSLKADLDPLTDELLGVVKESKDHVIRVEGVMVEYSSRAKTSVGYKSLFDAALDMVTKKQKEVLLNLQESTTKRGISEYLNLKADIHEGVMDRIRIAFKAVGDRLKKLVRWAKGESKEIDRGISQLEKLVREAV